MLNFQINNNTYYLPSSLKDITLKKFKEVSIFMEKDIPKEERAIITYYMEFISIFIDCHISDLKKVEITVKEGFGIVELFNYLNEFLSIPDFDNFTPVSEFNLNGINYVYVDSNLDTLKTVTPLEEMTFEMYEDATTVLQNFDKLKSEKEDSLSLLAAILFRPKKKRFYVFNSIEQYNSVNVKLRASAFQSLDMHTIYSAYFFLTKQVSTLQSTLQTYLKPK